jgi:hypothetical protein
VSLGTEQSNGDSSGKLPESDASTPHDLIGVPLPTTHSAPAAQPPTNPTSNSADSNAPSSNPGAFFLRRPATERSIGSKQASDASRGDVSSADTERLGEIYDYKETPGRVALLIFFSYGVSGAFAAILAGLINIPDWLPLVFTMIWIVWYFWEFAITVARFFSRIFFPPVFEKPEPSAAIAVERETQN